MSTADRPAILYVDDEETNLKVFRANFGARFPVILAGSAEQALDVLARQDVALILADERMPGMRGTELLAQVKERYPDVVRVVVTAYGDLSSVLHAVNTGEVWRYVVKPWGAQELAALIEGAFDVYRLTRERNGLQVQLMVAERRATMGLLVGSIGHELRNALSASMSAATVLNTLTPVFKRLVMAGLTRPMSEPVARLAQEVDLRGEAEELEVWVKHLQEALDHTSDIALGLVDSIRQSATSLRSCDLAAVAASVAKLCRHQLLHSGARLHVDLPPTLIGLADPMAVRQILLNLLMNAAQAIPEARRPGEVRLRGRREGAQVLLEVSDHGTGIPAGDLERIFEPLFSTKGERGTGLGLAISRDLAQQQGGTLTVKSVMGEGSTFTLALKAEA
ncbi:MAG: sensor histidine kinase [Myxococcales bacterium]